ncbi:sugar transferase [Rhodopseudomonas palustris]|nr:sugar transferase [Rhodopseudomonas palustris]
MKRFFDVVAASFGLVFAGPVIILFAILIRLGSKGSGIFRQLRVGKDERLFTCYKLRTMRSNTRQLPSHEVAASAVTPLGAYLRRYKIDELPQLWNIVRGEMSFVGPRPCLPTQHELIAARRRSGVDGLMPGITGVSQIEGIDMSEPERLAASDARYLDDMSLLRDLRLIWLTVAGAGRGDSVRS